MDDFARERLRPLAPGILLALAAIMFGFTLGGAFGVAEGLMKGYLEDSAQAVLEDAYDGDTDAAAAVARKSWTYFKRAHLHANALGTAALGASLLLALLGPPSRLARASGLLFGAGALVYGFFWLAAGLLAPGIGSTAAAKDALIWLAVPGSGMCTLGLAGTGICLLVRVYFGDESS
jgi:hypothetical protein